VHRTTQQIGDIQKHINCMLYAVTAASERL